MSQDHSLNSRQPSTNSAVITNPSSTNQSSPPGFENLHYLLSGRDSNIWSNDIANASSDSHPSIHQHQSVHPIQQHQQHFEFLQSDTNHYQEEQFNLEQSLASLTPTQEHCLLQMLQHQLLQQESSSYDRSINNHLECDTFSSHANVSNSSLSQQQLTTNFLNQSSHTANILSSNSAVGLPNLKSCSDNQDLYGGGGGFPTSVSCADSISNSLHRSSSDLGTRINSFYMDLGDLTTRNRNAALNEPVPPLCTTNQYLGHCLSNTSSLLSNTAANSLLGCHLENSSKVSMSSVPMPPDTRPLDNTKMLIAGKRIKAIGLDESQRAPGTPLSQTPPLKPLASSLISQRNGSLNNQIQLSKNVDSRGISSVNYNDNSGRSKRNKKYKQAFEQSTTQLKQNPDTLVPLHEPSMPCAPVEEFSTCATEQNILFEKMGSLSSSFVNWLSSDKSLNKPCESQNLENGSNKMVFNSIFGAVKGTNNTTTKSPIGRTRSDTTSAATSTTKASVPNKLSYSDVLSKQTSEKSAKSSGQPHYTLENGSGLSKSRYCERRMSNSLNLSNNQSGNSQTAAKRLQGNAGRSSPSTSIRSSSKPNLAFGTRVGLDEFNYPTLEELASIYQCSNFSSFSADGSMSDTKNSNPPSETGTAQGCKDSLSMMASSSNKKSKTAAINANNVLNNNNNSKLQSQKPSLKKSSFINNLSDAGGSGSNSSAEGSSADFSSVSATTTGSSNITSQHQQQLLYGCAASSSSSTTVSESSTDMEDISCSEKDTAEGSHMPQSTPLHTKSSNKSYGAGMIKFGCFNWRKKSSGSGSNNNNNSSSSRYRGSAVSNNNRVNSRSSKNAATNNSGSRKRRDVDSAAVLQAQLQALLQLCLTCLLAASHWLYHLVLEVAEMSSSLLVRCWERVLHVSITGLRMVWRRGCVAGKALADRVWQKVNKYWRPKGAKKRFLRSEAHYLDQHIAMPVTGEEAMKRLLACRGLDSYSILGVSPDASQEDIRRYYRRQAFLVHPDKNKTPGAEEAFKVLGHAFEEVGEPVKREEYDKRVLGECQLGEAWDKLSDLLKDLERKLEEAANMIRCTSCNDKHRRIKVPDRPLYASRYCEQCKIRHGAKDGDIWAESSYYGFWWQYFACMDGAVYNISEWAACQASNLRQLRANSHIVQYRIITGGKKKPSGGGGGREHRGGGQQQRQHLPSDPEIEEFFNQLYRDKFSQNYASSGSSSSPSSQHPGGDGAAPPTAPPNAGKRRGDRGGRRSRR